MVGIADRHRHRRSVPRGESRFLLFRKFAEGYRLQGFPPRMSAGSLETLRENRVTRYGPICPGRPGADVAGPDGDRDAPRRALGPRADHGSYLRAAAGQGGWG